MAHSILPYDPGVIPDKPCPQPGARLIIELPGLPPYKDTKFSIRNRKHHHHAAFIELRKAAQTAMNGRAWSFGPIEMHLTLHCQKEMRWHDLNDYIGGIADCLDGSSGQTFTFLPIVFEDDCQVVTGGTKWVPSDEPHYRLEIIFLPESA